MFYDALVEATRVLNLHGTPRKVGTIGPDTEADWYVHVANLADVEAVQKFIADKTKHEIGVGFVYTTDGIRVTFYAK